MSNPWPERQRYPIPSTTGPTSSQSQPESDHAYLIRMVQQLFVELEKINAKLDHPLYQITMPPIGDVIDEATNVLMPNPPVGDVFDPFKGKP